jgi:hypothetical protein
VSRGRRVAAAVVGCFALVATAVGPTVQAARAQAADPAGTWCAAAPLRTAADYGAAFAALGHAGLGWVTGDGGIPLHLRGGRVAWLFGDTFVGPRTPDGAMEPGWAIVHNTVVEQRDRCFRPLVGAIAGTPVSYIATPGAEDRVWPSGAFVRGNSVHVMLLRVHSAPGPTGFAFTVTGVAATTLGRDDLTVGPIVDLPALRVALAPGTVTFGESVFVSGADLYAYGTYGATTYVARTPAATFPTGAWRVWDGRGWNRDLTRAAALRPVGTTTGPGISVSVDPWSKRRLRTLAVTTLEPGPVQSWTATRAEGPWRAAGTVGSTSVPAAGGFAYGPQLAQLPGAGIVLVYSINDTDLDAVAADPSRYRLVFTEPVRSAHPRAVP